MKQMALIVPSRGRSGNIRRLRQALNDTESNVDLFVGVDRDDPEIENYETLAREIAGIYLIVSDQRKRFGPTLNDIAVLISPYYKYLAWCGDDHLPRTPNWDLRYIEVLDKFKYCMVYGNDLVMGQKIATQMAFTSEVVQILGYAVPPGFIHLYIDNYFMELFDRFEAVHYLPNVIVEHLHPTAGTAKEDTTYREANSQENWTNDRIRFENYIKNELKKDVEKIVESI